VNPAFTTPKLGSEILPPLGTPTPFKCPNCGAPIPVRIGSVVTRCEYCGGSLTNPIFESLEITIAQAIAQRMGPMMAVPSHLPQDMTDSQYRVLRMFGQFHGRMSPNGIAKLLKMDKNEFEKDADALRANGYLSNDYSLTKKGLDVFSRP
jgi:hypothetical protein